jgi:hypothetical protein
VSPWSASSFFTAATAPPGPVITSPINGSTVGLPLQPVTWSTASQTAYELRRVADSSSSNPDTSTVYWDSGPISGVATRSDVVPFETNSRVEHLQIRVMSGGLWSVWADARVTVVYTPPPVPSLNIVSANTDDGFIALSITHPMPNSGQPAVTSMDVFRSEDGGPLERVAAGIAKVSSWLYRLPASGVAYAFQVRVFAANGTTADSQVVSDIVTQAPTGSKRGFSGGLRSGL